MTARVAFRTVEFASNNSSALASAAKKASQALAELRREVENGKQMGDLDKTFYNVMVAQGEGLLVKKTVG